jgi:hypothetical protein
VLARANVHLPVGRSMPAAKVDFAEQASGADIEAAAEDAERRLRGLFPAVRYLFLDPTRPGGRIGE